jgi:hypothetical protein
MRGVLQSIHVSLHAGLVAETAAAYLMLLPAFMTRIVLQAVAAGQAAISFMCQQLTRVVFCLLLWPADMLLPASLFTYFVLLQAVAAGQAALSSMCKQLPQSAACTSSSPCRVFGFYIAC